MPFSINAPVLSDEELQSMKDSLSSGERARLQYEAHFGSGGEVRSLGDVNILKAKIEEMYQIINSNKIRVSEKECFQFAMEQCPDLVEKESNPTWFLLKESLDAAKAAQRLVDYWRLKQAVYGAEAYEPLQLTTQDQAYLRKGGWADLGKDRNGRNIIYLDGSKNPTDSKEFYERSPRICFYLFHLVSLENRGRDGAGCILILNKREARYHNLDRRTIRLQMNIIEMMPCNLQVILALFKPGSFMVKTILPILRWMAPKGYIMLVQPIFHGIGNDLIQEFEKYGVLPINIPESLGGGREWKFPSSPEVETVNETCPKKSLLEAVANKERGEGPPVKKTKGV